MLEWREQYRTYPWGQLPEQVCRLGDYLASVYEEPEADPDEPAFVVEYYVADELEGATGPVETVDHEYCHTLEEAKTKAERWLQERATAGVQGDW